MEKGNTASDNKKRLSFYVLLTAALIFIILFAVFLFVKKGIRSADLTRVPEAESYFNVCIGEGDVLSQQFTADDTGMRGVSIYPILDASDGELIVELADVTDGGRSIVRIPLAVSEMESAEWRFVPFRAGLIKDHTYEIRYTADSTGDGEIWMVMFGREEQKAFNPWFPCDPAMLNGEGMDGCIFQVLHIMHPTGLGFNLILFLIACGALAALCLFAARRLGILGSGERLREAADRILFFVFDRHAMPVCLVIGVLIAILLRIPLYGLESGDYTGYFLPWIEHYRSLGAADGLARLPGDYYVPLNLLLLPIAALPVDSCRALGIVATLGDVLIAVFGAGIVRTLLTERGAEERTAAFAAGLAGILLLLLPPVFLDSAAWKQADTFYLGFLVAAMDRALKEKWLPAWVLYGVAFVIKLQAIFLLPLLIILYFCQKFPLRYFLIPPFFYVLAGFPAILCGGEPRYIYGRYLLQVGRYQVMTIAFPNVYNLGLYSGYDVLKTPAVLFTIFCFLVLFLACMRFRDRLERKDMILRLAVLSIWICVMFLPTIHQRYGLGVAVLLFLLFLADHRDGWLASVTFTVILVETMGYADFLFAENAGVPMLVQTFLYLAAFLIYTYRFFCQLTKRQA